MPERFLQAVSLADRGAEDLAATRAWLQDRFPRSSTRRMTQLGLLTGAVLDDLGPRSDDAVVYASAYGESCALEGYLESFPSPSPTLFQTSIHPSAVQQAMILRQQPLAEYIPLTGRRYIVAQALQAALLSPAPRVILCAGEERGTWLLERGIASDRSFALAMALGREPAGALARISLEVTSLEAPVEVLTLPQFFSALRDRRSLYVEAAPGQRLTLEWR